MPLSTLADDLAALTAIDAPSGFEEPLLAVARERLGRSCDSVDLDVRGNLYGRLEAAGGNPLHVMLTAHADEIGFMVTTVLPRGYLRFTRIGQPTLSVLPGTQVRVLSKAGPLAGVIGVKPGHVLAGDESRRVPDVADLYIDVGAQSAEEAIAWGIEPGTPAVFVGPLTQTHHTGRYFGKAVDNRAGVLCVLEAARILSESRPTCAVTFVITVEEEIGLRGAAVAAQRVQPDVVLAVDTVPSGGTPDLRSDELPWDIGRGPLLKVRETRGLSTHGPLRQIVRDVAEAEQIPYQLIVDTAGITDGTAAQQASGDVAAMVLGLPRRYSHSAVELFDLADLDALIALTVATIHHLQDRSQLQRLPPDMTPAHSQPGTLVLLGTGTSMGVPMIGCDCRVCTSSNPRNQRGRTGVAVHAPQGTFLIDTPQELRLQLIRERLGMVEAVVYTHGHADHLLGLDDLRIFGYKRKAPVDLYCEATVEATIRQTFAYAFTNDRGLHSRPDLAFRRIGTDPFPLLGLTVRPLRLMHGQLPVLGFRIGDVAFCTDCNAIPDESWETLRGLDTLVLDALWEEEHPTHFSVGQAVQVIERLQPRRAYLTHISHRLDYDETNARLPRGIELAYDGLTLMWKD